MASVFPSRILLIVWCRVPKVRDPQIILAGLYQSHLYPRLRRKYIHHLPYLQKAFLPLSASSGVAAHKFAVARLQTSQKGTDCITIQLPSEPLPISARTGPIPGGRRINSTQDNTCRHSRARWYEGFTGRTWALGNFCGTTRHTLHKPAIPSNG